VEANYVWVHSLPGRIIKADQINHGSCEELICIHQI